MTPDTNKPPLPGTLFISKNSKLTFLRRYSVEGDAGISLGTSFDDNYIHELKPHDTLLYVAYKEFKNEIITQNSTDRHKPVLKEHVNTIITYEYKFLLGDGALYGMLPSHQEFYSLFAAINVDKKIK